MHLGSSKRTLGPLVTKLEFANETVTQKLDCPLSLLENK